MPTKTTKKTTAKTATAKTATRKYTKHSKSISEPQMTPVMMAVPSNTCGCNHECGPDCHCGCRGGCKIGRVFKKLIIAIVLLAIGFWAGLVASRCPHMRGPRVEFAQNGCMVVESVKCPKLRDALPAMDINQDGCITREEFRAVKHRMRQEIRDMQVQESDAQPEQQQVAEPSQDQPIAE